MRPGLKRTTEYTLILTTLGWAITTYSLKHHPWSTSTSSSVDLSRSCAGRFRAGTNDDSHFIDYVYCFVLNRYPEPEGRAVYLQKLRTGLSRGDLLLEVLGSKEFESHRGLGKKRITEYSLDDRISFLFQLLVRRLPTPDEMQRWKVAAEKKGRIDLSLARPLLHGPEFRVANGGVSLD